MRTNESELYPATTNLTTAQSIPIAICFGVVLVLAVVGNALVIGVIARHKGMRTRTNLFLLNLAIADFLVGVLVVPFSLTTVIVGRYIFGQVLCKINGFFNALFLMTSIHTLMYISIHKYLSILRPFSQFLTKRRIIFMILLSWLYPMVLSTLTVTGLQNVVYKNDTAQCGPVIPATPLQRAHHFIIQITIIIIPMIIVAYCYIQMYREIRKHTKRLKYNTSLELDSIIAQQKKVTLTLFIVVACFVVCWSPYMIYSQLVTFSEKLNSVGFLNIPAYLFALMNSACNPVIYALRSQPFREGYLEILCRKQIVIMNEDTIEARPPTLSSRVTHLWSVLKTSVNLTRALARTGEAHVSQCSIAQLGLPTGDSSKSMTQLMRERGNSVITKDGSTVIMKGGKIVSVRPSVSQHLPVSKENSLKTSNKSSTTLKISDIVVAMKNNIDSEAEIDAHPNKLQHNGERLGSLDSIPELNTTANDGDAMETQVLGVNNLMQHVAEGSESSSDDNCFYPNHHNNENVILTSRC